MSINEQSSIINSEYPPSPPPVVVPHYVRSFADIPVTLSNYLYSYIYIWTINDGSFWMYPISITSCNKICGYKWDRSFWRLVELDSSQVDSLY